MTNYELYERAKPGDQIFVRSTQKLWRKIEVRSRQVLLDETTWEATPIEELIILRLNANDPDEGTELVPN